MTRVKFVRLEQICVICVPIQLEDLTANNLTIKTSNMKHIVRWLHLIVKALYQPRLKI